MPRPGRRRGPSLDHLFVAAFALLGVRVGAVPIEDNSAFWHIRTGIDAVAGRGIPGRDPYSWTAAGEPWIVQSWLAELAYGAAHRVAAFSGVVVLNALVLGVVCLLTATLAATGRPPRTMLAAGLAVAVGAGWWSPRPLLFGLVLLGLTIWLRQHHRHPAWFVAVGLLWVNLHGSFVLGLAWLALALVGSVLASETRGQRSSHRRDLVALLALGAGVVGGAVLSPPGWRLLTFPATALARREAFSAINEWQRPDLLAGPVEMLALFGLVGAVLVVVVTRPPWRLVVPAVAFAAAALVSQRNMAAAGVVLAPALGAGLRTWRPRPAAVDAVGSARANQLIAGAIGVLAVLFLAQAARQPGLDLSDYPVEAVAWMDDAELRTASTRLVHTDIAGGYLILRDGRQARVFIDDRLDMYPLDVLADYRAILAGGRRALTVLDERKADAVLWPEDEELGRALRRSPAWERAFRDDGWAVWVRR